MAKLKLYITAKVKGGSLMKIFAGLAIAIIASFILDGIIWVVTLLGLPIWIGRIIVILLLGGLIEVASEGRYDRSGLGKFLRIVIFGALISSALLYITGWITLLICLSVILIIALPT